jgi:hypothetical protein
MAHCSELERLKRKSQRKNNTEIPTWRLHAAKGQLFKVFPYGSKHLDHLYSNLEAASGMNRVGLNVVVSASRDRSCFTCDGQLYLALDTVPICSRGCWDMLDISLVTPRLQ